MGIDDFGIISIMYHRFEENKYPSTNIRMDDFNKHLEIIENERMIFVNPNDFENNLSKNQNVRKILLTIDDGYLFLRKRLAYFKEKKIPFILFVSTKR